MNASTGMLHSKSLQKIKLLKKIFKSIRHKQEMYVSEYLNGTDLQKMFYR